MIKVLIVSGDTAFKPGNPRYDLQASVAEIEAIYCGKDSLWPRPHGTSFDVVTSQDPFWRGLVALTWARRYRARLNIQVHADLNAQSPLQRLLARYVLRRADSVRVVSEKMKLQVLTYASQARVFVLPLFIDVPKFASVVHREHPGKQIVWIGRFEKEKNPIEAIKIFRQVVASLPEVRLTMLGEGHLKKQAIKEAQGVPNIDLVGWQDPLVYLETADVLLVTSPAESFGAVIVEALAAGVPVVSPDVGVAREAGATVVPRTNLAEAVIAKLRGGARGILTMDLPDRERWVKAWLATLA